MPTVISTPEAPLPFPIFSQAVRSVGGLVYVSGNVGCTKDIKLVEGGVPAQTVRLHEHSSLHVVDCVAMSDRKQR